MDNLDDSVWRYEGQSDEKKAEPSCQKSEIIFHNSSGSRETVVVDSLLPSHVAKQQRLHQSCLESKCVVSHKEVFK